MLGKLAAVVLVFSWLPDCKGEGDPGSFEKFISPTPAAFAEMCSKSTRRETLLARGLPAAPEQHFDPSGQHQAWTFTHAIDGNGRGAGPVDQHRGEGAWRHR